MVFSTKIFLFFFFPLVFLLYYGIKSDIRTRNIILLISSIFFYAYGEPIAVFVMIGVILINYFFVRFMDRKEKAERKRFLILILLINISVLFVYKYLGLFCDTINWFAGKNLFGESYHIALPIGISFYIFQVISYDIDVYKRKADANRSLIEVALYISLFPQLIAGPIVRYNSIVEQIKERVSSSEKITKGFHRFCVGLAKKVLIADHLSFAANAILGEKGQGHLSVMLCWFGAVCYSLQIYYDFSGYSDMAIGLAEIFGFELEENFNYPYISRSVTEFWRRWHISLSAWLKDYIYIPLGGSRRGPARNLLNLFIVWCVTGLWHGANWTFLLWGLWYFIFIIFERRFIKTDKQSSLIIMVLRRMYTLVVAIIGWVIFFENDLSGIGRIVGGMFGLTGIPFVSFEFFEIMKFYYLILPFALIMCIPIYKKIDKMKNKKTVSELQALDMLIAFLLSVAAVYLHTDSPFIYFNF